MDQEHNSNQGDGQGIAEPMEEINEVAPMEGMTGDATVEEVNGAAAVNVVNGAGVNSAETQQPAALPINAPLPPLPTTRGRRPNANGNRRTSPVWLDFNPLPNEPEPIAACKHCHKELVYIAIKRCISYHPMLVYIIAEVYSDCANSRPLLQSYTMLSISILQFSYSTLKMTKCFNFTFG